MSVASQRMPIGMTRPRGSAEAPVMTQAGHLARVASGDVDGEVAAERQAAQDRPAAGRLVDDAGDLVDRLVPVEVPVAQRAVTGQVEGDHPEAARQGLELRVPHAA